LYRRIAVGDREVAEIETAADQPFAGDGQAARVDEDAAAIACGLVAADGRGRVGRGWVLADGDAAGAGDVDAAAAIRQAGPGRGVAAHQRMPGDLDRAGVHIDAATVDRRVAEANHGGAGSRDRAVGSVEDTAAEPGGRVGPHRSEARENDTAAAVV